MISLQRDEWDVAAGACIGGVGHVLASSAPTLTNGTSTGSK